MAISTYSLISIDELKNHLGVVGTGRDLALEEIANRVSDEIEQHLNRQIVTRGALTEYHTFRTPGGAPVYTTELLTLERPIVSVTSVHEDTSIPHTYGASALLTVDVDYQLVKPRGLIRRSDGLGTSELWTWGSEP